MKVYAETCAYARGESLDTVNAWSGDTPAGQAISSRRVAELAFG
jgi:hypothetical protein